MGHNGGDNSVNYFLHEQLKGISVTMRPFERHQLFKDNIKKLFVTFQGDLRVERNSKMTQTDIRSLFASLTSFLVMGTNAIREYLICYHSIRFRNKIQP